MPSQLQQATNIFGIVCRFFCSSGDDVATQRRQFEHLVKSSHYGASNFEIEGLPLCLEVFLWESDNPQKYGPEPMAIFVEKVRKSHCTVVLLCDEIRNGTRIEVEAAIDAPNTDLAVIVMPKTPESLPAELQLFLDEHSNDFQHVNTRTPPDHPNTATQMSGVITRTVLRVIDSAYRQQTRIKALTSEPFNENR